MTGHKWARRRETVWDRIHKLDLLKGGTFLVVRESTFIVPTGTGGRYKNV